MTDTVDSFRKKAAPELTVKKLRANDESIPLAAITKLEEDEEIKRNRRKMEIARADKPVPDSPIWPEVLSRAIAPTIGAGAVGFGLGVLALKIGVIGKITLNVLGAAGILHLLAGAGVIASTAVVTWPLVAAIAGAAVIIGAVYGAYKVGMYLHNRPQNNKFYRQAPDTCALLDTNEESKKDQKQLGQSKLNACQNMILEMKKTQKDFCANIRHLQDQLIQIQRNFKNLPILNFFTKWFSNSSLRTYTNPFLNLLKDSVFYDPFNANGKEVTDINQLLVNIFSSNFESHINQMIKFVDAYIKFTSDKNYTKIMREAQDKGYNNLNSLMSQPMQRIMRYELMCKTLFEYADKDHSVKSSDKQKISLMWSKCKAAVDKCNQAEANRASEHIIKAGFSYLGPRP